MRRDRREPSHHTGRRDVLIHDPARSGRHAELYIELDVEHPDYAPQGGFGYSLSLLRKEAAEGHRPFFEHIALDPASPVLGRVETPEGAPARRSTSRSIRSAARSSRVREGRLVRPRQDRPPGPLPRRGEDPRCRDVLGPAPEFRAAVPCDPERSPRRPRDIHPRAGHPAEGPGPRRAGPADRRDVREDRARPRPLARPRCSTRWGLPTGSDDVPRPTPTAGSRSTRCRPASTWPARPKTWRFPARDGSIGNSPECSRRNRSCSPQGQTPAPIECRIAPHVVIAGGWVDSKGKPRRGSDILIIGHTGGENWHTMVNPSDDGRFSGKSRAAWSPCRSRSSRVSSPRRDIASARSASSKPARSSCSARPGSTMTSRTSS